MLEISLAPSKIFQKFTVSFIGKFIFDEIENKKSGGWGHAPKCDRFHIDEYDEYYAKYLSLFNKNARKDKKINKLEKEILRLKQVIAKQEEAMKVINFDLKLYKKGHKAKISPTKHSNGRTIGVETPDYRQSKNEGKSINPNQNINLHRSLFA